MDEEFKLEDLEYVQSGGPSEDEMDKLDGCRVKVDKIEIVDDTTRYTKGDDGKQIILPEGQSVPIKKIKLTTVEFGQELIGRPIVHTEKYNLVKKDGKWIVSLHEKASTAKFLAKYKLDKFENAKGKDVVIVKKTNPETKKSRLTISI
jgi:hypothetical protein